jgi:hypothetical protein
MPTVPISRHSPMKWTISTTGQPHAEYITS